MSSLTAGPKSFLSLDTSCVIAPPGVSFFNTPNRPQDHDKKDRDNKAMAKRIVDVLIPVALDHAYSYRAPDHLELTPGDLVRVPLGTRECTGVVWADNATPNPRLDNRLKDIAAKLDIPPLRPELRKFVDWVSAYTLSSRGMVARMALRMGEHLGPERLQAGIRLAGPPPERLEESSSYTSAEHGLWLEVIRVDLEKVHRADDQVREDMITVAQSLVSVPRETVERGLAGVLM